MTFTKHFYVFLVFLRSTAFWIAWMLFRSDIPLSVALIYREQGQDSEYLPYVSALMRTGMREGFDYLAYGTGVASFPFGSVWFHSVLFKVFGVWGFVLADFVVATLVFFLLSKLLKVFKVSDFISDTMSLFVVIGVSGKLTGISKWVHGALGVHATAFELFSYFGFVYCACRYFFNKKFNPVLLFSSAALLLFSTAYENWEFFGWRFPRPFVTEIFILSFLILTLRLMDLQNIFEKKKNWVLIGVVSALLVQSEIYAFFLCGLLLGTLTITRLNKKTNYLQAMASFFSFLIPFLLCAIPFFIQRTFESPDVPVRYGAFSLSRWKPILTDITMLEIFRLSLVVFGTYYVFHWFKEQTSDQNEKEGFLKRQMAIYVTFFLASFALPLFTVFTGKVIEPGHFYYQMRNVATLVLIVLIGMLLTKWSKEKKWRLDRKYIYAIISLVALVNIVKNAHKAFHFTDHTRSDFEEYSHFSNYLKNFCGLVKSLESPDISTLSAIASYDMQVFEWWAGIKHGRSFMPDAFSSTLNNDELENRLIVVNRLLGFTPEEHVSFLNLRMTTFFFSTGFKHQMIKGYMYSTWDDYLPEDQKNYWSTTELSMNMAIPISERIRLKEKFVNFPEQPSNRIPDLVILPLNPFLDAKSPDPGRYDLFFKNEVFRAFKKKQGV